MKKIKTKQNESPTENVIAGWGRGRCILHVLEASHGARADSRARRRVRVKGGEEGV